MPPSARDLDVVIPVYEEGGLILDTIESFQKDVRTPCNILICYDNDGDSTLAALSGFDANPHEIVFVRNRSRGALNAVLTGFAKSTAPFVMSFMADDNYNASRVDSMVGLARGGYEIVCPSRFMRGGRMLGCPWLKAALVRSAAFTLRHFARLPTHDPTNGFRIFSRRVLQEIPIESESGFAYSLELLVKAHRRRIPITEYPVDWFERSVGTSRFRVMRWLPQYLRWYRYAFATAWLRRSAANDPRGPSSHVVQ